VLLATPQSAFAYAGMIGTLFAGGTFCPVKVDGPISRNAVIAKSFSPDVVLYEGKLPEFLVDLPATIPRIDSARLARAGQKAPSAEFSEVAYVVFTSGSTGEPKGVKIGRAGFSQFLAVARQYFAVQSGERWGQYSNLAYDLAVMDVFLALTEGGTLVTLGGMKDTAMPAAAIQERQIAIWQSVPFVLDLMLQAGQLKGEFLAPLRIMSFCGEPLLPNQLDALFAARPDLSVFNTYGATETMGFNTMNLLTADNYRRSCDGGKVALGDDVPGWTLRLCGGASENEGEIVVSSEHLSLGYWQDEDRTRKVFRQLRECEGTMSRAYFTGDRGIRKDGRLYFTCRKDRQVKIRGERIELDELDFALRDVGFQAAYSILVDGELYSFVEAPTLDVEIVRAQLAQRLPFHAIPKCIRRVDSLPRNANGKLDRPAIEAMVKT
jgi:D-alanine--poly(phosphoribitol) ligase subunit 1